MRSTPAPERFKQPFVIEKKEPPRIPAPHVLTEERVTQLVEEATAVLQKAVMTLNAEYENQMGRFAKIAEILK